MSSLQAMLSAPIEAWLLLGVLPCVLLVCLMLYFRR